MKMIPLSNSWKVHIGSKILWLRTITYKVVNISFALFLFMFVLLLISFKTLTKRESHYSGTEFYILLIF